MSLDELAGMALFSSSSTDDGLPTHTTREQERTEEDCRAAFEEWTNPDGSLSRDSCACSPSAMHPSRAATSPLP